MENPVNSVEVEETITPSEASLAEERVEIREDAMEQPSPIRTAKKMLLGAILGDACVVPVSRVSSNLVMVQSINQLPYLIWKMQLLGPLVGNFAVRMYKQKPGQGGWTTKSLVRCWTLSTKYLRHVYDDFYFMRDGKRKKEVHLHVLRRLTPESLAVWHMDDGYLGVSRYGDVAFLAIATCSFTKEECQTMADYLNMTWGFEFSVTTSFSKIGYPYLYGNVATTRKFIEIVRPYICPTMLYKIDPSHSAGALDDVQGYDMIRSLSEDKVLVRNSQVPLEGIEV